MFIKIMGRINTTKNMSEYEGLFWLTFTDDILSFPKGLTYVYTATAFLMVLQIVFSCATSAQFCENVWSNKEYYYYGNCRLFDVQGYYKWFIRFQNAILSEVLHVQIRFIYETNRKLTKFVICAPVGSKNSVPLENGDKARKEFWKRMNHL
jgi:hypothetical protein